MATYGVVPEGFNRKPLSVILAEIEADMVTEFGPQVIQTSQSPFGQINGVMAELVDRLWNVALDSYQSYDAGQAEGVRLDQLAKLRLLRRASDELDPSLRQAITNQGRARIDIPDIERAVTSIEGVTYVKVFVNDGTGQDLNLMPGGSICVAVLGGDDQEIANAILQYIVPGITTFGNYPVSSLLNGRCRSMTILRPILVPVKLTINIRLGRDNFGCPPPSPIAVRDGFLLDMASGAKQLINGDDLDYFRIRSTIESRFPNVEVVNFTGERDGALGAINQPVVMGFIELATLDPSDIVVNAI